MFDGVGALVQKDSKVDLFMPQCKYFTNLFLYTSLTRKLWCFMSKEKGVNIGKDHMKGWLLAPDECSDS